MQKVGYELHIKSNVISIVNEEMTQCEERLNGTIKSDDNYRTVYETSGYEIVIFLTVSASCPSLESLCCRQVIFLILFFIN